MPDKSPGVLTEKDKEFCSVAGTAGILISLACLFQHLYIINSFDWHAIPFVGLFIYCIIAFTTMILKKPAAAILVSIGAGLVFIYLGLLMFIAIYYKVVFFSYILIILFLFMTVIAVLMFVQKLPGKMTATIRSIKEEDNFWQNKL